MKRYSPILFIWLISFILSSIATFLTYTNGDLNESLAWGTATTFMANLIIYHFYTTSSEKKKNA
jgi:tryptophan-rich sensory protein